MLNIKAQHLNGKAAENSQSVLESLDIRKGETVADIGSGGGFFVFEFSKLVGPEGKVFAVDTESSLLAYIKERLENDGIKNVTLLEASPGDSGLPDSVCDLIFMRNVLHHIPEPESYLKRLSAKLKPGGRLAVIDWKPGASHHGHGTTNEQLITVMQSAGFALVQSFDILEKQVFCIFKPV